MKTQWLLCTLRCFFGTELKSVRIFDELGGPGLSVMSINGASE